MTERREQSVMDLIRRIRREAEDAVAMEKMRKECAEAFLAQAQQMLDAAKAEIERLHAEHDAERDARDEAAQAHIARAVRAETERDAMRVRAEAAESRIARAVAAYRTLDQTDDRDNDEWQAAWKALTEYLERLDGEPEWETVPDEPADGECSACGYVPCRCNAEHCERL